MSTPKMIVVDINFLETLPPLEIRSGLAEMLKHGLITNEDYYNRCLEIRNLNLDEVGDLIYESIIIKRDIVTKDPNENNIRKTLNYGHTLGHAIESYFINSEEKKRLLHGEAIAIGMILANYLSVEILGFPEEKSNTIKESLKAIYDHVDFNESDYASIIELLKYDKKNEHGNINFVLLNAIGKPKINCTVDKALIIDAFKYYSA